MSFFATLRRDMNRKGQGCESEMDDVVAHRSNLHEYNESEQRSGRTER